MYCYNVCVRTKVDWSELARRGLDSFDCRHQVDNESELTSAFTARFLGCMRDASSEVFAKKYAVCMSKISNAIANCNKVMNVFAWFAWHAKFEPRRRRLVTGACLDATTLIAVVTRLSRDL